MLGYYNKKSVCMGMAGLNDLTHLRQPVIHFRSDSSTIVLLGLHTLSSYVALVLLNHFVCS